MITPNEAYKYLGIDIIDDDIAFNVAALVQVANSYMIGALGADYPVDDPRVKQVEKMLVCDLYDHREMSDKASGATRRLVDSMLLQIRLEMRGEPDEV